MPELRHSTDFRHSLALYCSSSKQVQSYDDNYLCNDDNYFCDR